MTSPPPDHALPGMLDGRGGLESLISHLVSAKRSLSSIDHVWRANEIVTTARTALEESLITGARFTYIRQSIADQLNVLRRAHVWVQDTAELGTGQFEATLQELDEIDSRLHEGFNILKATSVEAHFRNPEDSKRSLHDFVDEKGFENLKVALQGLIDNVQEAQAEFDVTSSVFAEDIKLIEDALQPNWTFKDLQMPIPALLGTLESHAAEMADLLSSLVRHYDLCVTAVRHTEGGGAAATNLTSNLPAGVDLANSSDSGPQRPFSEEERQDLLNVIDKDASEVDDAVQEIKDHLSDMEAQLEHINAFSNDVTALDEGTDAAFSQLEAVGSRLPQHVNAAHVFLVSWEENRQKIEDAMQEMILLREFYDGFLLAYDELILEVARRRKVQNKMESIVKDALNKVNTLYENDLTEREAFRQDSGQFLPSDIWPGLLNSPARFDFIRLDKEASHVPHLSKEVIERARQRTGK